MMKKNVLIGIATCPLALSGCALDTGKSLSPGFGIAQSANMKAQIIDPAPAQGLPETPLAKQNAAVERYLKDQVKEPEKNTGVGELGGGR